MEVRSCETALIECEWNFVAGIRAEPGTSPRHNARLPRNTARARLIGALHRMTVALQYPMSGIRVGDATSEELGAG